MSAAALSLAMRRGEVSSAEITKSVFSRIHAVEDRIGAYLTLCEERAMEQAFSIDARRAGGEELLPLAGIPIAIKDNICTKGVRTTCASKMLAHFVPPYDATVAEKLFAAGAVLIGKTNMDEFAMGSSCENSALGHTGNPHDLTRVPGGSSGGSAAALAAGEAVLALGSDTGGSVRQPASFCGVVGLKPTYGAVSRYGLVAFASSFDQIGPLARTVGDAAMLFHAICGFDPRDATSARRKDPDGLNPSDGDIRGLRVGLPREYFGAGVADEVRAAVLSSAEKLRAEGAIIREISLPSTDAALAAYYVIACAEASSNLARFDGVKYGYRAARFENLIDLYETTRSEGFGDEVKRRIMLGTMVLSTGYADAFYRRARRMQRRIASEFAEAFSACDLLLTPTAPTTAFHIGEKTDDPLRMYAADICTVTANLAGLPAISVPCGESGSGMPIGIQLIGPRFSEQLLFFVASYFEKLSGGFKCIAGGL